MINKDKFLHWYGAVLSYIGLFCFGFLCGIKDKLQEYPGHWLNSRHFIYITYSNLIQISLILFIMGLIIVYCYPYYYPKQDGKKKRKD